MPFTQTFPYSSKGDKEIFANLVSAIKNKLERNLKINLNEAIVMYSALVVYELAENKPTEQIQKNALRLLNPGRVMIGVPETLRKMYFEITLDGSTKSVTLDTPIAVSDYILQSS